MRDYGLVECQKEKKETAEDRFKRSCLEIAEFIIEENPDIVVMEGVTYQRNSAVMTELAQFQGVIIGACLKHGIDYYIYYPSTWRRYVGILKGNQGREELKKAAMKWVSQKFRVQVTEDVAEAICIGKAYLYKTKKEAERNGKKK